MDFENDARQRELEKKYGPPPFYEDDMSSYDRNNIPPRSSRRRRNNVITDPVRKARNPGPNYTQFKRPEYVDTHHREYRLAGGSLRERFIETGDIAHADYKSPDTDYENSNIGTQVFWIRIPIRTRGEEGYPDVISGEIIRMYHIDTQVMCTGEVDSVFYYGGNRKTGYVVMNRFRTHGQNTDPSEYNDLVTYKGKKRS